VNHFQNIWKLYTEFPPGTAHGEKYGRKRQELLDKIDTRDSCSVWEPRPKVSFLGAFDTVAGCSWDRKKTFIKLRIRNLALESCVERAVHLLSVDDNRIPSFEPLLWTSTNGAHQKVEQIWMPGVHSDVGGSSSAVLIGYISLLTMISRIKEHCPELEFEPWFNGEIMEKAFSNKESAELHVSNERPNLTMQILDYGTRLPGKPTERPGEMIHMLLREMDGARINIRGDYQTYRVDPAWLDLPVYSPPFHEHIDEIVKNHKPARR
jgi:hypothetical protein